MVESKSLIFVLCSEFKDKLPVQRHHDCKNISGGMLTPLMMDHFMTPMKMVSCPLCSLIGETHIKLSDLITGNIQTNLLLISEPGLYNDDLFLSNNITVFLVQLIFCKHMKHNM